MLLFVSDRDIVRPLFAQCSNVRLLQGDRGNHSRVVFYVPIYYVYFFVAFVEYCASHAVPSVKESQYLKHIGDHLHPDTLKLP